MYVFDVYIDQKTAQGRPSQQHSAQHVLPGNKAQLNPSPDAADPHPRRYDKSLLLVPRAGSHARHPDEVSFHLNALIGSAAAEHNFKPHAFP